MLEQTGLARARRRARRTPLRRQPPARQRRARLIGDPPVLALDEPSSSLDPASASACGSSSRGARRARHGASCSPPTTSARPSATPTACSCSPTGGCCSTARPPTLLARRRRAAGGDLERALVRVPRADGAERGAPMSSLLRKDLLILRRSRLLVGAARRLPGRDRAADRLRDLAQPVAARAWRSSTRRRRARRSQVGSQRVAVSRYAQRAVQPGAGRAACPRARRRSARSARATVLAAVVIPPDIAARLASGIEPGAARSDLQRRRARAVARAVAAELGARRRPTSASPNRSSSAAAQAIDAAAAAAATSACSARPTNLIGLQPDPARCCSAIIARQPPGRRPRGARTDRRRSPTSPRRTSTLSQARARRRSASRSRSTARCCTAGARRWTRSRWSSR